MGIFNLLWEHALRVGMEFDAWQILFVNERELVERKRGERI